MDEAIVREILSNYGILQSTAELLSDRDGQVVRVVDENQSFLLRIEDSTQHSNPKVEIQLEWMSSIGTQSIVRVPELIPLLNGNDYGFVEAIDRNKQSRFRLFKWLDGERKSADEWVEKENLFAIGQTVAQLHEHAIEFGIPEDSDSEVLKPTAFLRAIAKLCTDNIVPYLGELDKDRFFINVDQIMRALEECIGDEWGLIHADLGPQNWIFEHGKLGLIDFESYTIGYFIHDLLGVLWSHSHWEQNQQYLNWLFQGYESVRPISDCVKSNVFNLQAVHCVLWIGWVLGLDEDELKPYIPDQIQLMERLCEQNRKFS